MRRLVSRIRNGQRILRACHAERSEASLHFCHQGNTEIFRRLRLLRMTASASVTLFICATLIRIIIAGAVSFLLVAAAFAQSPAKANSADASAVIPVKVNVVISEYEGAKKVSVLPYTLSTFANKVKYAYQASLRMGLSVPMIYGSNQVSYKDVGTDIDCDIKPMEDNLFQVSVSLQRSSVYPPSSGEAKAAEEQLATMSRASAIRASDPIFGQFNAKFNAVLRDGQTKESTVATDPISGHVIKVDVTLHVVKE
ncbi:MAG TPA: hypothetical protein VGX94_17970 [Terriglobia bacterium]|nr:hypothetical protein [Terriglobia bacterium]